MRTFDESQVAIVEVDEPATGPTPLSRCLAELVLQASAYAGGSIMSSRIGGRAVGSYDGSKYLGRQPDGRYAWTFGHEGDGEDFRADAMLICQSHGIDCGWAVHPTSFGGATVLVELDEVAS